MLDVPSLFKKYDSKGVCDSILALPKQCAQAWREASRIKLPASYRNPKNIVVAAMGGSALAAYIIKDVFSAGGGSAFGGKRPLQVPFEVVNHYRLPAYVGQGTLVFVVSYSGTTEEVLEAAIEAKKRNAQVVGITIGGALGKWLAAHKVPRYIFEPRHNPSGQPRLGTGYTMMGMLAMLCSTDVFGTRRSLAGDIVRSLKSCDYSGFFGSQVPTSRNPAKQIAQKLKDRGVLIFASEHLVGNAHALANQLNETAKQFAAPFVIPEMNHHLLEGLTLPKLNPRYLAALFLNSKLYHPRVAARYPLTAQVLRKQSIPSHSWSPSGSTPFSQALEALSFGSFISFYGAMLSRIDPSRIPWVDYFKRRLS